MRNALWVALGATVLLWAASCALAQDPPPADPAPDPAAAAPAADPAAAAPAVDPAAEQPAGPSLADRLQTAGAAAAATKSTAGRYGPKIHDGSSSLRLSAAGADAASQIIQGTVRVRVDGMSLLPTDYAMARLPDTGDYVIRFLRPVEAGAAVEVTYRVGSGDAAAGTLSRGFMGAPGEAVSLNGADLSAGGIPVKLYWGQESQTNPGVAASAWQALSAIEGMRTAGRREYGFGFSSMRFGDLELSYGNVTNESGEGDASYRTEFVRTYMVGSGVAASASRSDPSLLSPEGASRDVTWGGIKYGDPSSSKFWYVNSHLRMDQNYSAVAESGAAADMAAFLSDANRWGGRNLVSPWWSGYYAGVWKSAEGAGNQGRSGIGQFAGWELSQQGYGFRAGGYFTYSKSEFAQERLDTHQRFAETQDRFDVRVPRGGPEVTYAKDTLTTTTPASGLTTDASSGRTIATNPGENTTTTHETLSLTQRLSRGQNAPVVSVSQHQWNQLNRLSGVESPTVLDRTTTLSGVSLLGVKLDYQNSRSESEDIYFDPTESHRLTFGNMRLAGPISMDGSFSIFRTDAKGVTYIDNTLSVPGFRIFEGANVSGMKYQKQRDSQGAEATQRTVGFAGQLLGGQWNASYNWQTMAEGFLTSAGALANGYGQDYDQRVSALTYQKTLPKLGTELRAGWTDTRFNGESLGQVYRVGASQLIKPGAGLGNIILQGAQYRHVDRWGTLRPSYSWAVRYDHGDRLQAGMRGFEHYGAGDEMQFVSRTTWLKTQLGPATLSATWRSNPLLNEAAGKLQPFLWRGESKEYSLSGNITPRLAVSASIAQNALPAGFVVESSDWSDVAFAGPMSSALRPTTWSWDENWGTTYSVSYNFGAANLTLGRSRTRFNRTAALLTAWTADLNWKLSANESLGLAVRDWRGASPIYGQSLSVSDVGHPLGVAYALRYSRDWGNGKRFSLVFADAGPLNSYWGQNNAWGQEASSFVGSLPYADYPHTKVYMEFQTPF